MERTDKRIEDYAVIGNTHSAALVSRDGSIDWLCLPRFDSAAMFAALLGDERHGSWRICAKESNVRTARCYRPGTAILETRFETEAGAASVIDFMPPPGDEFVDEVIRLVRGDAGVIEMAMTVAFRFDYGRLVPWLERSVEGIVAIAGPTRSGSTRRSSSSIRIGRRRRNSPSTPANMSPSS